MNICVNEQRFWGNTDSETIQNAIDYAAETGLGAVVIPRCNERTGTHLWSIEKTIYLPDDMTVYIDNAHLRLADGVRENIFRNRLYGTELGNTTAGEQHDIRIIGMGNAVLDGGKPNGLTEQMHRDDPEHNPHMSCNLLIGLHNVRNFLITGLNFIESRWWAVMCMYCRWGRISNLDFRMYGTLENQDGIDLRVGCEYITIENITGCTGDDTIALTGLGLSPRFEVKNRVEGKSKDIHDITIHNVISSSHGCSVVRLLNCDGVKEYNITIDTVKDTGESISGSAMLIGAARSFAREKPHGFEDFQNIVIRNVSTCAQRGLTFAEPMRNVLVENLTVFGRAEVGIQFAPNFACDDLTIRNVHFCADPETADCVFNFPLNPDNLHRDLRIEHVRAGAAKYVFRQNQWPITDFVYEAPTVAYFTPEKPKLASAYGRYHRCSYGKVIENRPSDNRFKEEKV